MFSLKFLKVQCKNTYNDVIFRYIFPVETYFVNFVNVKIMLHITTNDVIYLGKDLKVSKNLIQIPQKTPQDSQYCSLLNNFSLCDCNMLLTRKKSICYYM
jgi:hypothetical protein